MRRNTLSTTSDETVHKPSYIWLWSLIFLLIISHYRLSAMKRPFPAASGVKIHAPIEWKDNGIRKIRVSTYNIHHAKGEDGVTDISRTASLLVKDDIVGLQEVSAPTLFWGDDQAAQLAEILETGWLFSPSQERYYQTSTGNSLLSRLPIQAWHSQPLAWMDDLEGSARSRRYRNMIVADLMLGGKTVKLFVTHLDRGQIRHSQLKSVLQQFDLYDSAILMADLNTYPNDTVLQAWLTENPEADAIAVAMNEHPAHSWGEELRLDWILIRGFRVLNGGFEPVGISDHPYLWVELELL